VLLKKVLLSFSQTKNVDIHRYEDRYLSAVFCEGIFCVIELV